MHCPWIKNKKGELLMSGISIRLGVSGLRLLFPVLSILVWMSAAMADTVVQTTAYEYDPDSGQLIKQIIEPGQSALCLVTQYGRDSRGNLVNETQRNCNGSAGSHPGVNTEAAAPAANTSAVIASATSTVTYDTQGRYAISAKNPLNHVEGRTVDARFGEVLTLTDPNGLVTTRSYDGFGRLLSESRPDNTSTQYAYTACGGACPTHAYYKVVRTQAGQPVVTQYYDIFDRVIQSETQDKDGAIIYSLTEYDKLGRVSRVSRPFRSGDTIAWTTTTHDTLDRPLIVTAADSSQSKSQYYGLIAVHTNALNQTRVEHRDSEGKVTQVIDAKGGAIHYQYDAMGNLIKTIDAANNAITMTYDARGRKIAMNDPDQGNWTYSYDVLGQLKRQTDAKLQVTSFVYDKLGRLTSRAEPSLDSVWFYDTCAAGNSGGKCIGKLTSETSENGNLRRYYYDGYGRLTGELNSIDTDFNLAKTYDAQGRVATIWYPDGFITQNTYSTTGYLTEVRNVENNALLWQANTIDAEGRVTQHTYGNGISTTNTYHPQTGRISQISAGPNGSVSDQTFLFDAIGNLEQRHDAATGLNESFGYDHLNRLIATTAQSTSVTTSITVTYDAIGNIQTKSDVGTYTYGTMVNGVLTRPHAVTSITKPNATNFATYTYDANGNQTSGGGRTLQLNSWNMPSSITKDGKTFTFVYNSQRERIKQTFPVFGGTQTTYNINPRLDTGIHVERHVRPFVTQHIYYLYAGTMPFGTVTRSNVSPPGNEPPFIDTVIDYFHTDHLGSLIAITNQSGTVTERRSYDAWGKRRNLDGSALTTALTTAQERHGYTLHEELPEAGLIHMNGRLYDPQINRFLSVDPIIQYPTDMQSYNAYSYLYNNPMNATDPSGFAGCDDDEPEVEMGGRSTLLSTSIFAPPSSRSLSGNGRGLNSRSMNQSFFEEAPFGGTLPEVLAKESRYIELAAIEMHFDFDKFASQIEQNRSTMTIDILVLGSTFLIGTMPKTSAELRGLGIPKNELNPTTSQLSRWSGRVGMRSLRTFGRTAAGIALSTTSTATLVLDGFYNWGVIGRAAWDATSFEGE